MRLHADPDDPVGRLVGISLIGGARTSFYIKEISNPAPTVGAMLRPGAIELLPQVPATKLAGKHARVEDLWPGSVLADTMDQLR